MSPVITYIIIGFIAVIGHCIIKANSLQRDAKAANLDFSVKDYLTQDWFGISLSFLVVILWVFLFEETAQLYPQLEGKVKLSFAGMGFLGSYILQTLLSRGKKLIRAEVDRKTNIADAFESEN